VNLKTDTSDLHVAGFQPLIAPNELLSELPLSEPQATVVHDARQAAAACRAAG